MKGMSLLLLGLPSWAPKCLYGRACSPRKWSWMHWHSTNQKSKITCKPEWFPDMPEAQLAGIWCAPNLLRSRNGHQTCHKEKGLYRAQTWAWDSYTPSPAEHWGYHSPGKAQQWENEGLAVGVKAEKQKSSWSLKLVQSEHTVRAKCLTEISTHLWKIKLEPCAQHGLHCTALHLRREEPWTPRDLDLSSPLLGCGYFSAWFIMIQRPVRGRISHSPLSKGHKQTC